MAFGTIVIDLNPIRTDSDICDDLLEYDVVIVEIGTRPTKSHRKSAISDDLKRRPGRWGKEDDGDVLLQTFVVNSKGRICTYDTIDDVDKYDEFDVLHLTDEDGISAKGVRAGIETLAVEWRLRGKPSRYETGFDYDADDDKEDEQD